MRDKGIDYNQHPTMTVTLALMLSFPCLGGANNSVLSGEFDGNETRAENLPGGCSLAGGQPYREIPFRVTESGTYHVFDAFTYFGINVTISIYEEEFNAQNPQENLVAPGAIETAAAVDLFTNVDYVALLSEWCPQNYNELFLSLFVENDALAGVEDHPVFVCPGTEDIPADGCAQHPRFPPISRDEGAWAVGISGPGAVDSDNAVEVPDHTSGTFTEGDPMLESDCGNSQYQQTGPIRVSRDGTYYYTDLSIAHAVDMCLQIFTAPLNANNPAANRVAVLDDAGAVILEAGRDYYFLVQPLEEPNNGEFFYVFAPPAPFRLNPAMGGSWYNPKTPGQGFFIDFFDTLNLAFLSWFTYDLTRPESSVEAQIGDPGHRWLTAQGPFSQGHAELAVDVTVGGVFDSGEPMPTQSPGGSITLDFDNCLCGELSYDLGGGLSGVVPISRIAFDSCAACEATYRGPGMPGPL